ncbi:hypothetical protein IE077_000690, partial [Cardiosporidium cionae]
MLQAAHIGIQIQKSNEFQILGASDYVIPHFNVLRHLLFFHGRLGYLRLSTVILWLVFKAVFLVFPLFFFNFISGWSAPNLYSWLSKISFTFFWTSLPIIIYGIQEVDIPLSQHLYLPILYVLSRRHSHLNFTKFIIWLMEATLFSLISFLFFIFTLWEPSVNSIKQRGIDMAGFGCMLLINVILCSNMKLLMESHRWTYLFLWTLFFLSSILLFL